MSNFPDMGQESQVVTGEHVRAIGWLLADRPYRKGLVNRAFLDRLRLFANRSNQSAEALNFAVAGGFHTCEFCGHARGARNFGVPSGDLLFVAPEMVVHYLEQHEYFPPEEFVVAVLDSPLPGTDEYRRLAKPFCRLHSVDM